ncbi:MAG: type VI secretion system tube protein Hcp [Azospirillaceae bacterium]|nr:type VI secretion system tube protein Hcp [Azospirillaceae bacterium]
MPVILVKIPSITGDCAITSYQGCIVCKSCSIGGTAGTMGARKMASASTEPGTRSTFDAIELTKTLDIASPLLFQAPFIADTDTGAEITISFLERNQSSNTGSVVVGSGASEFLECFMTITLTNSQIVYYSLSISESGTPAETFKLSFDSLALVFTELDNAWPQRTAYPQVAIDIATTTTAT